MDRRFKYLWNKQVIYRRYPITDIPDEETEHYMFYKSGTYQCYDLFRINIVEVVMSIKSIKNQ